MRSLHSPIVAVAIVALASCTGGNGGIGQLAPVAALPKPTLPPWIESISPTKTAQSLSQIRVIFAKPVAPLTELSGAGPQDVLGHFSIEPALAGHFTLLTPRMVGFVADRALPIGTRVKVTVSDGLRDLNGESLANDLAWTFQTDALSFKNLPTLQADDGSSPPPSGVQPKLQVTANAAVDPATLAANATLVGGGESVDVTATAEATPSPYPGTDAQEMYDPSLDTWVYDLRPNRELRHATTYALRIAPGVMPAYGNLATTQSFSGKIRTYGALALLPTPQPSPDAESGGRFADGDPSIAFNNPLDPKSLVSGTVTIVPSPAAVKTLVSVPDQSNTIAIDPYALDPDTSYNVTIAGSLKDVFGQTLGQDVHTTIRTSDFTPGAWSPSGTTLIASGTPVALNFYATNLPDNAYSTATTRLVPQQLLGNPGALSLLPPSSSWARKTLPGAKRNAQSSASIALQQQLGSNSGALAYGFRTALDAPNADPSLVGIVQLTNLGVFAQWFPARGMVLVQHLSDGQPVRNAAVAVYRLDPSGKLSPQQCASGKTNAAGELDFSGIDVERCSVLESDSGPNLGVTVTEGADVATVTTWSYSGTSRFDVYSQWTTGAPLSRGTIFTDRSMYQPGEHAEITGIAYYVKGSRVVPDANATYKISLVDPSDNTTQLGSRKTDAYGVFSLPVTFSNQQALGYYTVNATGTNGNQISGSLRVAQFKPPNFNLTLTLGAASASAGSSIAANVAANYLFGAPLQGGTAHADVTRDVATVQPKGWDDFSFGPQWFWPEETPSFDSDVLQRDLPLDAKGNASLDVPVPRDLPFPMTYTVDMETSDVSNLSVADSQTFLALPSDAVIGLASDTVGQAGTAMPIRVIVTDAAGKAIAGRAVHLQMQKMTYTSVSQETEGGENAQDSVKYDNVATTDVTSADQPVTAQLTPSDTGPYRIVATFPQVPNNDKVRSDTDLQVFAFGSGAADWGMTDPNSVAVKLDKKQYAIGSTASALVASPYRDADIYLAVIRNDTLYRTTLHDVHGAAHVTFKVTPDMLPNAALEAVVIRRGPIPHAATDSDRLALTGLIGFNVDVADRYLQLKIAPRDATVHPGGPQHVDFQVTGRNGAAAPGEVVAMVVNDAILQLSGYRLPDLVQTVFASQPISTMFADNRENLSLKTQTPPLEKGYGYGGGFLAGAAGTRVRTNFLPMAYYGVLKTDAAGRARADFTMPDDLTTWRVMAVALGSDTAHFATADGTFISTQPLIANPLLPQFARPGDRFDLGAAISNQTGAGGALDLVLKLSGALAFAGNDPSNLQASETATTGTQAFRFPVTVGTPAATMVSASAALGSARDAFSVPFTASDRETTDSVIESGATATQASVPVAFGVPGTLQITLANSIVPQFVVPSQRVMIDDSLPLADENASKLVIASALGRLRGPYRLKLSFDPAAAAASNLQSLLSFQRSDGGFEGYANAGDSDPFVTASALEALLFAREHGVTVSTSAVAKASSFLAQGLANPGRFQWCASDPLCKAQVRFEALWALAQRGAPRTDFLSEIVAQSSQFDSATQIRLARYLLRVPGWQAQGAAMADRLQQTIYVTGRYAVANVTTRWGWLGSLVDAQSQMLQLMIERHTPAEQVDGAVRALVAQQCKCGWPTTDDTASALIALSAYAAGEHFSPGTATATMDGRTIATATFGTTASSVTTTLPVSQTPNGAVNIMLRAAQHDTGRVHYTILYTYPVANNAPGEFAAFRVIRTLTDPSAPDTGGSPQAVATMDLATAAPAEVTAGRVFDVGVRVIVDHPVDRLVIDDPLPAGFEAVDTSFRTTLKAVAPQSDSWQIDTSQIYRDRVVAYAEHLDPGVYDLHYLVRSVTPGTFAWPGAHAYLKDAPEEFGRSAGTTLTVSQ